jgi:hypothetical protein
VFSFVVSVGRPKVAGVWKQNAEESSWHSSDKRGTADIVRTGCREADT